MTVIKGGHVRIKRVISTVAGIALIVGGLGMTAGVLSASATTLTVPTISISPSIGLTNGQTVTITGSGFEPNEASLNAVECNPTALVVGAAGCNIGINPITPNADGDFTASFTVATGAVGTGAGAGTCGTSATDATCFISIGSTATDSNVAGATISFASGPGVEITPSTGLKDGSSVTITGSGFADGDSLVAVECLDTATTPAGCDTSSAQGITATSTGALPPTTYKVVAGTIGTGKCGTTAANYDDCVIEVAEVSGADQGFSTIDFAAPAVSVTPIPAVTRVSGTAVIGRSVAAVVIGKNFTAVSRVTGGAGSTVKVTSASSTAVHVKITESAHVKAGTYALTVYFKSGKTVRTKYTVK